MGQECCSVLYVLKFAFKGRWDTNIYRTKVKTLQ